MQIILEKMAANSVALDERREFSVTRGVVIAATGPRYIEMANNAAAGLKRHSPGLPIHLFTDGVSSGDCFDAVIRLENPWRRSKIDAMIASPFDQTLYLDADTFVVADVTEIFDLLERFDIVLAHDQERNSSHSAKMWRRPFGAAFPQFNSGVIAYRRSPAITTLLHAWRDIVRDNAMARDQPVLRELLWNSDVRIATLPPEYNMMDMSAVLRLSGGSIAPRIIHHYRIHRSPDSAVPPTIRAMMGEAVDDAITAMIAADKYIAAVVSRPPVRLSRWRKRVLQARMLLRSLVARIRIG